MSKKNYMISLDMTGPFSSWCLADENKKIITEKSVRISRKSNSVFFNSLLIKLKDLQINFNDISKWFVGVGPGSYTGIRVGVSFVAGIQFCREDVEVIGIPSYFPIAAELRVEEEKNIGVIFQVTNKSVLVYDVRKKNAVFYTESEPVLYNENNISMLYEKYNFIVTIQDFNLNLLISEDLKKKIKVLDYFPVARMFDTECNTNCRNMTDLIYTRPAVTIV